MSLNKIEAHQVLNRVKNGLNASFNEITEALIATGDLGGRMAARVRSEVLADAVETDEALRQGQGRRMAVADDEGHRAHQGQGWSRYLESRHESRQCSP